MEQNVKFVKSTHNSSKPCAILYLNTPFKITVKSRLFRKTCHAATERIERILYSEDINGVNQLRKDIKTKHFHNISNINIPRSLNID